MILIKVYSDTYIFKQKETSRFFFFFRLLSYEQIIYLQIFNKLSPCEKYCSMSFYQNLKEFCPEISGNFQRRQRLHVIWRRKLLSFSKLIKVIYGLLALSNLLFNPIIHENTTFSLRMIYLSGRSDLQPLLAFLINTIFKYLNPSSIAIFCLSKTFSFIGLLCKNVVSLTFSSLSVILFASYWRYRIAPDCVEMNKKNI